MRAVIDIGSNSVRLCIYKIRGKNFEPLMNKKYMVGLAKYKKKGLLNDKGKDKICQTLMEFKEIIHHFNIDKYHVFATASLRNISNQKEVVDLIFQTTGFNVEVISGEKEACLDFDGAMIVYEHDDGLLFDIGGGSTEVVLFENRQIKKAISIPLGSLNSYMNYVDELIPHKSELQKIEKEVTRLIAKEFKADQKYPDTICGVGGSIRATIKLQQGYLEDKIVLKKDELKKIYSILVKGDKECTDLILDNVPERFRTMTCGCAILVALVHYFKCDEIIVSQYGVREGYLKQMLEQ